MKGYRLMFVVKSRYKKSKDCVWEYRNNFLKWKIIKGCRWFYDQKYNCLICIKYDVE